MILKRESQHLKTHYAISGADPIEYRPAYDTRPASQIQPEYLSFTMNDYSGDGEWERTSAEIIGAKMRKNGTPGGVTVTKTFFSQDVLPAWAEEIIEHHLTELNERGSVR